MKYQCANLRSIVRVKVMHISLPDSRVGNRVAYSELERKTEKKRRSAEV